MKNILIHGKMIESPVTVIDHAIQELLLAELLRKRFTHMAFNGEEDTHLKFFFSNNYSKDITLHCDPIDGTENFAKGQDRFSVGFGLSRFANGKHDFFSSVVYSPLEDILYWSFQDEKSRHVQNDRPLPMISSNRCLNEKGIEKVQGMGYSRYRAGGAFLGVIDVALGRASAFLHWCITVHDALIAFSFAKNNGVVTTDWNGNRLKKFDLKIGPHGFEPIPKICYFANDEIKEELLPILQNPKYTV